MAKQATALPSAGDVRREILKTLSALHTRFITDEDAPEIRDDQNAPNLTMACEVLETFLVPALYGGMQAEVSGLLSYADARKLMSAVISQYQASDYDNEVFRAGSYLGDPEGGTAHDAQVVDAASFCLTACMHFRAVYESDVRLDGEVDSTTANMIDEALTFLWSARAEELDQDKRPRPTGWNWGRLGVKYAYRYFTYVALDGVLDFLFWAEQPAADWVLGEAGVGNVRKYRGFVKDLAKSILTYLDEAELTRGMLRLKDDVSGVDQASWYYNLWTIYSLLMMWETGSTLGLADDERSERLSGAIELLISRYMPNPAKPEFERDFQFNLAIVKSETEVQGIGVWLDRGFAPLMLKSYSSYVPLLSARTDATDDNMGRMYKALQSRRLPGGEWDTIGGFSIYYTERAIEGLVNMLDYLAMDHTVGAPEIIEAGGKARPLTIRVSPDDLRALLQVSDDQGPVVDERALYAAVDRAFCVMESEFPESGILDSTRVLIDEIREDGDDALMVFVAEMGAMSVVAENLKKKYQAARQKRTK